MPSRKAIAAAFLASTFAASAVTPASAGGGDFAAGLVGGVILGTVVNEGLHHRRTTRTYKRTTRRAVQDPQVTAYWREVQSALNETGYNVGRVDGVAGSRTRSGVRAFQSSLGEEPNGTLSTDQYNRLMQMAGFAPSPQQFTDYNDPGRLPPAGGPADSPEYFPDADTANYAPPPVETPAAPALQTPDATAYVDTAAATAPGLSAFDAPKRLTDAALDDIAASVSVMGVGIGSPRAEASEVFADAVGGCRDTGTYSACAGGTDAYTDDVAYATAGTDDAAPVYFVTRTLAFNQPVPAAALKEKLAESLGPIIQDSDMTLTNAAECDRALVGEGAVVMSASLRSNARGNDPDALADVTGKCKAFFAVSMDGSDAGVNRVTVRLFDGRMLEPVTATAAVAPSTAPALPADPAAPAVPADVKF